MIVVLDSNIWISGLLFRGKPAQAIVRAFSRGHVAICCEMVEEIEEVCARKFSQNAAQVKADLDQLLLGALWVPISGQLHLSRDPDDDIVLECARNAKAHVLVTGDRDLLDLKEFEGTSILTADEFLLR
ncbi:MAG: putative toxin-antitoxin system toxin component, PIN family [Bryobacteraceae bacterium]